MSDHNQIAQEIVRQLGGMQRLSVMLGSKSFVALPKGLQIMFKAKARNKANIVEIELSPSDLYNVKFKRLYAFEVRNVGRVHSGIGVEQLKPLIEAELGLRLSL